MGGLVGLKPWHFNTLGAIRITLPELHDIDLLVLLAHISFVARLYPLIFESFYFHFPNQCRKDRRYQSVRLGKQHGKSQRRRNQDNGLQNSRMSSALELGGGGS